MKMTWYTEDEIADGLDAMLKENKGPVMVIGTRPCDARANHNQQKRGPKTGVTRGHYKKKPKPYIGRPAPDDPGLLS